MIPLQHPHAAAALALALVLDAGLGEFPARAHPVVWMGTVISWLERAAPASGRWRQLAYGTLMAVLVPAVFAGAVALLVRATSRAPWVQIAFEALALKSAFAVRELGRAGAAVGAALREGRLGDARANLRSLCSRDASRLDAPRIAAAAVESLAENASDSAVAPILCYLALGVPGAVAYRAVNTLDARVGYRGRFEHLGKAAALLDDLANLLPARATALLLLAAGALTGKDVRRGARVLLRDGARTESPNAGRPMAAMAGLLGVELEKVGHYRLGDAVEPASHATIAAAWRVVTVAAVFGATLALVALGVIDAWRG